MNEAPLITTAFLFQYDFGKRFEMVLLTPASDSVRDFRLLQDTLRRAKDDSSKENLFDFLDGELAAARDASARNGGRDVRLVMPEFSVEAEVDANAILRRVRLQSSGFISSQDLGRKEKCEGSFSFGRRKKYYLQPELRRK